VQFYPRRAPVFVMLKLIPIFYGKSHLNPAFLGYFPHCPLILRRRSTGMLSNPLAFEHFVISQHDSSAASSARAFNIRASARWMDNRHEAFRFMIKFADW